MKCPLCSLTIESDDWNLARDLMAEHWQKTHGSVTALELAAAQERDFRESLS